MLIESVNRPAWTSDDLEAFKHLHRFGEIIKNHFVKKQGLTLCDEGNKNEKFTDRSRR